MLALAGQDWARPTHGCGAACSAKCADTDTNTQCGSSAADYERWEREGFRGPGSGGSTQAAHDYGTAGQYDFIKDQTAVCSILHALHMNDVRARQPLEYSMKDDVHLMAEFWARCAEGTDSNQPTYKDDPRAQHRRAYLALGALPDEPNQTGRASPQPKG